MSVSFIACPECNTLLLGDTAQCPSCRHVLDTERAPATAESQQSPGGAEPSGVQDPCPGCGEMVRRGLVRCWNCGTFMRDDIAESYQRMKSTPAPIIYSPMAEGETPDESPSAGGSPVSPYNESPDDSFDDDFELAPDIVADDEDFEEDFEITGDLENQVFEEVEEAYRLMRAEEEQEILDQAEADKKSEEVAEEAAAAADGSATDEEEGAEHRSTDSDEEEAHSIATGGDVLLKVALEEEAEIGRRRLETGQRRGEGASTMSGIVVFCPNGHRIEVQERHRGKTGRCPRCREPFIVPAGAWNEEEAEPIKKAEVEDDFSDGETADVPYKVAAGEYSYWMQDAHYHTVDISKLKLKAGSLEKSFELLDLAFAPFGMLMITLLKKKSGLFASSKKQEPEEIRETVIEHLSDERPLDELPAGENHLVDAEEVKSIRVVQPAPTDYESMFAGIPVFGEGRIAVRFPKGETETEQKFSSFTISEFRIFAEVMNEMYDMDGFGEDCDVPLTNVHTELKCHYSEETVKSLEQIEYYQADEAYELKLVGRKCQECGLVVSEESRKKEKIGGASGKGIAKAKCPKCSKKFGNISLYEIEKGPVIGAETDDDDVHTDE